MLAQLAKEELSSIPLNLPSALRKRQPAKRTRGHPTSYPINVLS